MFVAILFIAIDKLLLCFRGRGLELISLSQTTESSKCKYMCYVERGLRGNYMAHSQLRIISCAFLARLFNRTRLLFGGSGEETLRHGCQNTPRIVKYFCHVTHDEIAFLEVISNEW